MNATLECGLKMPEAVMHATRWWDNVGRKIIFISEYGNPDIGFDSGVTRGLPWEELKQDERKQVLQAWIGNKAQEIVDGAR